MGQVVGSGPSHPMAGCARVVNLGHLLRSRRASIEAHSAEPLPEHLWQSLVETDTLEDAEAVTKAQGVSPRGRLWIAATLILLGTAILVSTVWAQATWSHPDSHWSTRSRTYSGVLTAANQSAVILIDVAPSEHLRLSQLWTNDTPVTITVRNWNGSVVLQLPNYTYNSEVEPIEFVVFGGLGHHYPDEFPTLEIARVTADVSFSLSLAIEVLIPMLPYLPPFGAWMLGYLLGAVLVTVGFITIERVLRDIELGRL